MVAWHYPHRHKSVDPYIMWDFMWWSTKGVEKVTADSIKPTVEDVVLTRPRLTFSIAATPIIVTVI